MEAEAGEEQLQVAIDPTPPQPPSMLKCILTVMFWPTICVINWILDLVYAFTGWPVVVNKDIKTKIKTNRKLRERERVRLEGCLRPAEGPLVTSRRRQIVSWSMERLLVSLRAREVSCLDVLEAYQSVAIEINKKLNCITEFLETARDMALRLDQEGPPVDPSKKPLFGLPFSVKENVEYEGLDMTMGCGKYLGKPMTRSSPLLLVLKELGAIPFCRTNVPQICCSFGAGNPVYGTTGNPYAVDRTPGGSSSGEGALVASGGSLLGVGNDMGGSVRMPAVLCGCYGLKPTFRRLSSEGIGLCKPGELGYEVVPGFLTRDAHSLSIVMRAVVNSRVMQRLDRDIPYVPFDEMEFISIQKLRIGYYKDDGYVPSTSGAKRAVNMAKATLERVGHELVPFTLPSAAEAFFLYMSFFLGDDGASMKERVEGEGVDQCIMASHRGFFFPRWIRRLALPMLDRVSPIFAVALKAETKTSKDLIERNAQRKQFIRQMHQAWDEAGIDACIAPGFPCPSVPHKYTSLIAPVLSYHLIYNLVEFPVGVVPMTLENQLDQARTQKHYPNADLISRSIKQACRGAEGLPLGVQVVARPWNEERVMRLMNELERNLEPPFMGLHHALSAPGSLNYP